MNRARRSGFTLIEMMVVISVIILVAAMMIPLLNSMAGANRVENGAREVQGYLMMAKQQAVQYHQPVAVAFMGPTTLSPFSKVILLQLSSPSANPGNKGSWQVMPGAYGMKLPVGVNVTNDAGNDKFYFWFDSRGLIDDRVNSNDLTLNIGPSETESQDRTLVYTINRSTGAFLQFTETPTYKD